MDDVTQEMREAIQKKCEECMEEILLLLDYKKMRECDAAAVLGALMGSFVSRNEDNDCLISFLTSFTRTYHANYKGTSVHEVSREVKIKGKK